jgi:UDP-glucose 4-epimerase
MANVLVTGGAGFLGSHVCAELLKLGHRVLALDDLSGGFRDNVPAGAGFGRCSITDHRRLAKLFAAEKFEYVFHLAAYAAENLSVFIKRFNYNNNLIGSVNLINESVKHKVKRFVFTSSIAAYGSQTPPFEEDRPLKPVDSYGIAKYTVEQELKITQSLFGLDYVIFRPHNIYGENQNTGDKYRNVMGIFINQLIAGREMTVFGDGEQTRQFSYVGDIAPIMAASAADDRFKNQVFNIGSDRHFTVNEIARLIAKAFGSEPVIRHLRQRHEVVHAHAAHKKLKDLGFMTTETSLEEGIRRMVEWTRKTGIRKSKKFKDIEIREGLPEGWG